MFQHHHCFATAEELFPLCSGGPVVFYGRRRSTKRTGGKAETANSTGQKTEKAGAYHSQPSLIDRGSRSCALEKCEGGSISTRATHARTQKVEISTLSSSVVPISGLLTMTAQRSKNEETHPALDDGLRSINFCARYSAAGSTNGTLSVYLRAAARSLRLTISYLIFYRARPFRVSRTGSIAHDATASRFQIEQSPSWDRFSRCLCSLRQRRPPYSDARQVTGDRELDGTLQNNCPNKG